jgi:hypothetical protein
MITRANGGEQNRKRGRFCVACGTPLVALLQGATIH